MKRRWEVVARDVNGDRIDVFARFRTRRRAEDRAVFCQAQVWEIAPGRPLYTVHVERV